VCVCGRCHAVAAKRLEIINDFFERALHYITSLCMYYFDANDANTISPSRSPSENKIIKVCASSSDNRTTLGYA